MNSVDIFFKTALAFCFLLSSIMVFVSVGSTISTFKSAKKEKSEINFNVMGFFLTVVIPSLFMISFAIVYSGVVG